MRIIGPPSADRTDVLWRVITQRCHARFETAMFPALWEAGEAYGIDPVGVVAQAAKETDWGNFTGKVRPEFHNTCGLKVSPAQQKLFPGVTDGDNPLAHAMFASWEVGAKAHVQHLRAYTGWPLAFSSEVVDPRYQPALKGPSTWCENFEDLGGKWAPAADYGVRLVEIAQRLHGRA